MNCEMCGKAASAVARIEGAQLTVCASCARHGTLVRQLPQAQKPSKKMPAPEKSKEELIEQVRPDVARLLRQHREKLKLNQEQFAARLQIRASTYNHYESGAITPDIATARKLEHVLGVPLVVHVKVGGMEMKKADGRSMTMADFIKRKV